MKLRNPFKPAKRSHKTALAVLLIPIAAIWDKVYNVSHRKKVSGWKRLFSR